MRVNWFKLKVEVAAWVAKTALCTGSALVAVRVLYEPSNAVYLYPESLTFLAYCHDAIPVVLPLAMGLMWLCYWKVFSAYRGFRRYRECAGKI